MSVLSDPVVTLEGVRLEKISLSAVDLAVTIRVENKNPVGATLESCPFSVSCEQGGKNEVIATGETGSAKIPGNSVTDIPVQGHLEEHSAFRSACRARPWGKDRGDDYREGQDKIPDDPKRGSLLPDCAGDPGRDR